MSNKQKQQAEATPQSGNQPNQSYTAANKAQDKSGEFQPHNARKESLGPNTKR